MDFPAINADAGGKLKKMCIRDSIKTPLPGEKDKCIAYPLTPTKKALILSLIHISKRGKTPGKLSFLCFQKIRGMDFLGNILAVHLVQDILERGNIVRCV